MNDPKIARLRRIAGSIAAAKYGDLAMRIPADPHHDADLIVDWAADEIERLHAVNAQIRTAHAEAINEWTRAEERAKKTEVEIERLRKEKTEIELSLRRAHSELEAAQDAMKRYGLREHKHTAASAILVLGAQTKKLEGIVRGLTRKHSAATKADVLPLPVRLQMWADNEEMIDQHYTEHGYDCLEAADLIEQLKKEKPNG
jgi:chromosome segregation ATPase